jgi:hypothetical protein
MENATLVQVTRAYHIADALGHGWPRVIGTSYKLRAVFEEGGMQAVKDLVYSRRQKAGRDVLPYHPVPEVASVDDTGCVHWRVHPDGALTVKVMRTAGIAFTMQYDANGRLIKVIPGQPRLPVGRRHVATVAEIVTAAFWPYRPDWKNSLYFEIVGDITAAGVREDEGDPLGSTAPHLRGDEFIRPAAALREAGYTGEIEPEHLRAAFDAIKKYRPFAVISSDFWGEYGPAVVYDIEDGDTFVLGRPLTREELAAVRAAAEAVT